MGLFESIIEFKANIPSIMGLRLGESYHDSYDLISLAQERHTGDTITDNLLEYYGVFVDVDTDENDCINEITLTYYGNADVVVTFLRKSFNYSHFEESRKEDWVNCELERSYKCEISNDTYCIVVTQNIDGDKVSVIVTSQSNGVSVLQGANIYYYHEPLGLFAVNNSQLSLSLVNHAGVLSRSDVINNLLMAMKLSNTLLIPFGLQTGSESSTSLRTPTSSKSPSEARTKPPHSSTMWRALTKRICRK